jgi:hypothetical protein
MAINGKNIDIPIVRHEDIAHGGEIVFEMSDTVEEWGNGLLVGMILCFPPRAQRLYQAREQSEDK